MSKLTPWISRIQKLGPAMSLRWMTHCVRHSRAPLFTIVVPTFNAGAHLGRALESLRRQILKPIEVLVLDADSTDNTLQIVQSYRDIVTFVVSEPDRGQAHAINKGFALARGKYIGWLCADDELMPDALQTVVDHMTADPELDLISGGCERKYEDGSSQIIVPQSNAFEIIGAQYRIEQASTFWRRSLLEPDLFLDESYHFTFDWDFFVRLSRKSNKILIVSKVMSTYHFSPTNKTSTGGRRLVEEMFRVVEKYGPLEGKLAKIFWLLYRRFDLAGCYDRPATCDTATGKRFARLIGQLEKRYGRETIHLYNWNFASKQERGLLWYK